MKSSTPVTTPLTHPNIGEEGLKDLQFNDDFFDKLLNLKLTVITDEGYKIPTKYSLRNILEMPNGFSSFSREIENLVRQYRQQIA